MINSILIKVMNRLKYGKDARNLILKNVPKGAIVAEVGVWKGDFADKLLSTNLKKLYLIDPWNYVENYEDSWYGGEKSNQKKMDQVFDGVVDRFIDESKLGKVEIIRKASLDGLSSFKDAYFDMIYIDGDHMYNAVQKDLEMGFRKIKSGGILAGDDYGIIGWWEDGVKKAVDEFIITNKDKIEKVELYHSQFAIVKI
jgi:hypothetical protein